MGYLTCYTLNKVKGSDEDYEKFLNELQKVSGYDFHGIDNCQEGTWYDHEKHMLKVSKKFPDLIVELSGDGENSDDVWAMRFQGGRSESVGYYDVDANPFTIISDPKMRLNDYIRYRDSVKVTVERFIKGVLQDMGGEVKMQLVLDEDHGCSLARVTDDGDVELTIEAYDRQHGRRFIRKSPEGMTFYECLMIADHLCSLPAGEDSGD